MKRWLLLAILFGILYLVALSVTGVHLYRDATETAHLVVEPVEPRNVPVASAQRIKLSGSGFTDSSRVFLHMNVNNRSGEVATLPFNETLFDMERVGDTLLLAGRLAGIRKVDISDPQRPKIFGQVFHTNGSVLDIERHGDELFLSCGRNGVQRILMQSDLTLKWQTTYPTWGTAIASKVVGDYLYVVAGKEGLFVYPLKVGSANKPVNQLLLDTSVYDLAAYGGHLYVAAGRLGVLIYSLDEPAAPTLVGRLETGTTVRSVSVANGSLFLVEKKLVSQFSLLDPARPQLLEVKNFFSLPSKIFSSGDRYFVTDSQNGMSILSARSGTLGEADFYNLGGDARTLSFAGPYLFVGVSQVGLKVFKIADMLPRQIAFQYKTPGTIKDFEIAGGLIYLLDSGGRLQVDRLPQEKHIRSAPVVLFEKRLVRHDSLYRKADRLYLVSAKAGTLVLDISAPELPQVVAEWPEVKSRAIVIKDNYLVSAHGSDGLELYRLDRQGRPLLLDAQRNFSARTVALANHLLIVPGGSKGLRIYRIEKGRLQLVSSLQVPFPLDHFSWALQVAVQRDVLYVANGESGLLLIDLKKPQTPRIISSINLPGYANNLLVEGDRAYVTSRYGGVHTIDISDRKNPRLLDTIPISDLEGGIARDGDLLYLGNRSLGVTVIPLPQEVKQVSRVSGEELEVLVEPPGYPGRYSLLVSEKYSRVNLEGVLNYR